MISCKSSLSSNDGGVWGKDIESDDEGTIVIRSTEITIDGKWDLSNPMKRKLDESETAKCKLYEGDIVITKSSGSPDHIGKSVIVSEEVEKLDYCYSNFVQRIRFGNYDARLYHYILNSYVVREQYRYLTQSTTGLGNLNRSTLNEVQLPFIPLSEQHQIVEYLDEQTQKIDELIEKTEQKIELLKENRTSLINHCVTKGLNPNVEMKDSGVDWIGEIPSGWVISKLKWFSLHITDGSHFSPITTDEGRHYVTVSNVTKDNDIDFQGCERISDESFSQLQRGGCQPNIGDVLITKDGTIGRGLVVERNDFVILSSLGLIRTDSNKVNSYYLLYYLLSGICVDQMYSHIRGSGITRLTIKLIKDLLGIFPPLPEQNQIVEYLDEQTQKMNVIIEKETKRIELLKEYRQSLISEAVIGKIDVRNAV